MIVGRSSGRKAIILFAVGAAIVLIGGYVGVSFASWRKVEADNKDAADYIQSVKSIFKKEEYSRGDFSKMNLSDKNYCDILPLFEWQKNFFSKFNENKESCEKNLASAKKYSDGTQAIGKYLKNDESSAKIVDNFINKLNSVEKTDFENIKKLWSALKDELSSINEALAKKAAAVESALSKVVEANNAQDRRAFNSAKVDFEKAMADFVDFRKNNNSLSEIIDKMKGVN